MRPLLSFRHCAAAGLLAFATVPALAQQPTLPSTPPQLPPPGQVAPPTGPELLLGHTYRVETAQGTAFTGQLISLSLTDAEFDSAELGRITLPREQIRRASDQSPAQPGMKRRPSYFDIGNGSRLFFAPTGRGLRKGEGTLQSVNLFLAGANYGITDNISMGGYLTLIPGLGINNQLIALTPKVSFPVSDKWSAGVGALYLRIPDFDFNSGNSRSYGTGIVYGAATYGSADDNVTFGLGYGFFEGEVGRTPILQVGGQKRVSRRISLISENYILADKQAGMGGLYGLKINWTRISLGIAALYAYAFPYEETSYQSVYNPNTGTYTSTPTTYRVGGEFASTYIIPVYLDLSYRFGKGSR